ncbi:MAG: DNA-binding protein Alba [Candidatus Aenigmarchaeota archaeon]|nr:DNA-binding protein Alba [Candidatus Aenigmarchaeota archaeon]
MTETQKAPAPVNQPRRAPRDENVIYVGKKPTMSYVLAVMTQFSNNSEVRVKARGRSISIAVDVVEAVRNKFVKDARPEVQIGTDQVQDQNGRKLNVSTIDILLRK